MTVSTDHLQRTKPSFPPSPPTIRGLPLLGNSLEIMRDPFGFLPRAYEKYGPVFGLQALGRRYMVLAGVNANRFLAQTSDECLSSCELFLRLSEDLRTKHFIPALNGSVHRHYRRIIKPSFSHEAVVNYSPTIVQVTERMVRNWQRGQSLYVKSIMQPLVCEQLGRLMMNYPLGTQFKDVVTFVETLFGAGAAGSLPAIMLDLPPYRRAKARLLATLQRLIAQRQVHTTDQQGEQMPDLLDILLAAHSPEGQPLSENDVLVTALLPYIAGMGQTAPICGFLLYELLKRPSLLEQVIDEVDKAFAEGMPSADTLGPDGQMKTLYGATLETLRLYPVAIAAPRYAVKPLEFEGYPITPRQWVFVGTSVTHFLAEFFPHPSTFDVTRYYPPRNEHLQPDVFTPFALGPHACVANKLAKAIIILTVATILHTVRLALDPPEYTLKCRINPVPAPEQKFRVRVVEQRMTTLY